jgi:hypothetical protein
VCSSDLARKYAGEREQFKQSIDQFPAVYDLLTRMKLKILAARTLLYETTRVVDLRQGYTHLVDNLPAAEVTNEMREKQKRYSRLAAVLTPMSKAYSTEIANQVAYDGIQIHGGTGYMHDFNAERFYRDARITNIYEGTTQLQVVAAIGGVLQRTLDPIMDAYAKLPYDGVLERMNRELAKLRPRLQAAVRFVADKRDPKYHDLVARPLVEMETLVFVGHLLLRDARQDLERRAVLAEKFVRDAIPEFERHHALVMSGDNTTIDHHREIIDY